MHKGSCFNRCKLRLVFIILTVINFTVYAQTSAVNELELSAIASLDNAALDNDQWQTILPVLGDEDHYFIASRAGKIYQLHNNKVSANAFFDLKLALKNPDIITLTAITLDPNFHYRDKDGYHIFYTAHTEKINSSSPKLSPVNTEVKPLYDTVVTRWKVTNLQHSTPQVSLQNEVLRIAIMQVDEAIQQLSFNPYIEPWHDDFGLLFIALARNETLKNEALYAGAILRIKPEKYGLQNYTIPVDNPFTKVADIENEIIFIAGQKTQHFDWIKQSTYSLLVQYNQTDSKVLIEAKIGGDWREAVPDNQIKKRLLKAGKKHKTLVYQGRDLKSLWGKVLHLQENENEWQLNALTINSVNDDSTPSRNISHKLINHNTKGQSQFSLHQKHNGELLLLEHSQQRLYAIKKPTAVLTNVIEKQDLTTDSTKPNLLWITFCFVLILIGIIWYFRNKQVQKQSFFQRQWANFEVNLQTQSVSLYKRHNKTPEISINISSLVGSEILLNDEVISTVSANEDQPFSNELEDLVLATFGNEHRIKMMNDKHRKIQLCLSDEHKQKYMICLYYRVGNIRHTKLKYQQIIDKAIDWQWLFSELKNPTATTKRKIKAKPVIKKTTTPNNKATTSSTPEPEFFEDNSTMVTQNNNDFIEPSTINIATETSNNAIDDNEASDTSDTNSSLVADLDKLVMMKKQGYLNEVEFNAAKAKILQKFS